MVEQLKILFYLPVTYVNLFHAVKKQKVFLRTLLANALHAAGKSNDGSIQESDIRKITDYYAMGVPAILGEAFCILRGKPMDTGERSALTYLGAITGLFDDFFDKERLSEAQIQDLIIHPDTVTGANDREKLFLQFYNKALAGVVNAEQLKMAFFSVYLAQVESKKQTKSDIGKEELFNITLKKGGASFVFYRKALTHPLEKQEEAMIYSLGGLMQLGNDIFDVYKDSRAGIRTLANTAENIETVKQVFSNLLQETFHLVEQTKFPQQNINAFIRIVSLGISRCFVCLHQFEKLEKCSGNKFIPSAYARAELICDIEKPGNMLRSVYFHVKTWYSIKAIN
jgi:hypothetical protein